MLPCTFHIEKSVLGRDTLRDALFLTVPDVRGTYTILYIQSERCPGFMADLSSSRRANTL